MDDIDAKLNSEFGYCEITRNKDLYTGTGKKHNYDDLKLAYTNAKRGFQNLISDKESAIKYIQKAIDAWEEALKESDTDNKKARINNKITAAIYCNLVEAYVLLGDFSTAEDYLDKITLLDSVKNKFESSAEYSRTFMEDQKKRTHE